MTSQRISFLGIYVILLFVGASWAQRSTKAPQDIRSQSQILESFIAKLNLHFQRLEQKKITLTMQYNSFIENNHPDSSALKQLELKKNQVAQRAFRMGQIIDKVIKLKERVDSSPKNFDEMNLAQISSQIEELMREREVTAQEATSNYSITIRYLPDEILQILPPKTEYDVIPDTTVAYFEEFQIKNQFQFIDQELFKAYSAQIKAKNEQQQSQRAQEEEAAAGQAQEQKRSP